ncbi:MAG: ferrochelatase [Gemmatimonadetes bacterium]|nr:ferrochelatase [Gemmatimonadota bacterium]
MTHHVETRTAVLLLNFGEPDVAVPEVVVPYLERIFQANAELEGDRPAADVRARSRALAERRAPALIEEYRSIGGSPLKGIALAHAGRLEQELERRGVVARCYVGMQFAEPFIEGAVQAAIDGGATSLIAIPTYPLCGPSTTLAALRSFRDAVRRADRKLSIYEVTGWHRHPAYLQIRADAIRTVLERVSRQLGKDRATLVFAAHGTPLKYVESGSRYVDYVNDCCRLVASAVGVEAYQIGYQNHGGRGIAWTQPEIHEVLRAVTTDAVVVDAISFMHEQSETLAELDLELRAAAENAGLEFHRVPVPHDDPRFPHVLADLVESLLGRPAPGRRLELCACAGDTGARCLNRGTVLPSAL